MVSSPEAVGDRDFDVHVLAGLETLQAVGGVQGRGRRDNGGRDAGAGEAFGEVGGPVRDAALLGGVAGLVGIVTADAGDLDAVDLGEGVEVFLTEGTGAD